jgi:hypothetical protein
MSRSYCFTINNPEFEDFLAVEEIQCRYIIYGLETGESGTPHIQGYLELEKPQKLATIKKVLKRAHLEKRMGTREQAKDYCMKDGEYVERGDWKAGGQGARTDIARILEAVRAGDRTTRELIEEMPGAYGRNMRLIQKYKEVLDEEKARTFRDLDVQVYVGDSGSGKTRKAIEENPLIFTVNSNDSFPFEGYDGQKEILIDDFYGGIKYAEILRILDGHRLRVNIKGGHRYALWTKVIITSNKEPHQWYKKGLTPALSRRLKSVTEFRNDVAGSTMPPPFLAIGSDESMFNI